MEPSLLHTKIGSIEQNFGAFENSLQFLYHHFTIIGVTETWLRDDSCDRYGLTNYLLVIIELIKLWVTSLCV